MESPYRLSRFAYIAQAFQGLFSTIQLAGPLQCMSVQDFCRAALEPAKSAERQQSKYNQARNQIGPEAFQCALGIGLPTIHHTAPLALFEQVEPVHNPAANTFPPRLPARGRSKYFSKSGRRGVKGIPAAIYKDLYPGMAVMPPVQHVIATGNPLWVGKSRNIACMNTAVPQDQYRHGCIERAETFPTLPKGPQRLIAMFRHLGNYQGILKILNKVIPYGL